MTTTPKSPKSIDTLIPDIQALFEGHEFGAAALKRFSDQIAENLGSRFAEYGNERQKTLRLSNIGKPLRQLWFEIKSGLPGEPLPPDTKFKFLYGDILEQFVLVLASEAGHEVTRQQEEVIVDGVKGHIDAVIDGYLVDAKSCSSYSFKKFQTGTVFTDDPFGYVGQLSGYANSVKLPAAWLAIDKVLGHMCLTKLDQETIDAYNVNSRIAECRKVLASPTAPEEKCYADVPDGVTDKSPFGNGNRVLGVGCSYCPFKRDCWKDANGGRGLRTFTYYNGPKFFTKVVKEPRAFEVKDE